MSKKANRLLAVSLKLIFCSLMLTGCKYYRYKQVETVDNEVKYEHYIIHVDSNMMELKEVIVNPFDNTISGALSPFIGEAREAYDEFSLYQSDKTKCTQKRDRKYSKESLSQVHISIQGLDLLDTNRISINFSDIDQVETYKNNGGRTALMVSFVAIPAAAGAVGLVIGFVYALIYLFIALAS